MTQITLNQTTQAAIQKALIEGAGAGHENYVAAYNAIYSDINRNGSFNSGTLNWFSQAAEVNGEAATPTASGTFIWSYTKAAAKSEGATLTDSELQEASDKIAFTVFDSLRTNGFVFSDNTSD